MDLLVDCSPLPEQRLDVVPNHQQQLKRKSGSKKRKERNSSDEDDDDTKKRHRRTAHQIERKFRCEVPTCGKAYGSEGALKMHVRLKHSESFVSKPSVNEGTAIFYSSSSPNSSSQPNNFLNAPQTVVSSPTQMMPHMWTTTVYGDVLVPIVVEEVSLEAYQQPHRTVYVTSPTGNPQLAHLEQPLLFDETDSDDIKDLKEKYCYIPLLKLNIGLWQAESQCCGDLVAKFSYEERCIIWEIFDVGSLLRTVISFDNLNGVGLEFHPDDTATLVIELQAPPTFFKGVLRPYESTLWTQISDFTEGMASTFRRHILHFSRRALTDSIESIFQRDPRLQSLLLQGLPALKSPYFSQLEKTTAPAPSSPTVVVVEEPSSGSSNLDSEETDSSCDGSPIVITIESSYPQSTEEETTGSLEVAMDELSKCALQNLQSFPQFIDSSLAHSKEEFQLPCCHTQTISPRDLLLRESFCTACHESYYFSFCKKKPVSVHKSWHCLVCNTCRGENEWHCPQCDKCTTSPPSLWGNSVVCQKCCSLQEDNSLPQGLRRNCRRKRSAKPDPTLLIKPQPNNTCFIKPQPNITPRLPPPVKPQPTLTVKSENKPSSNNTAVPLTNQKPSNPPASLIRPNPNLIKLPTQTIFNIKTK